MVKQAENKGAYDIPLAKGSVVVADRFYNDFHLLNIYYLLNPKQSKGSMLKHEKLNSQLSN